MTNVGILPKDIYLMMTDYSSDKDIVNMLSVNKTYNDPVFFKRIITKRYPVLLKFKREKESWKNFYLRMIYSLSLLKEKYDVLYINSPWFDPISVYEQIFKFNIEYPDPLNKEININHNIAKHIGETGDEVLVDDFVKKIGGYFGQLKQEILSGISRSGNIKLFQKYDKENSIYAYEAFIANAIISQNSEMINYLLQTAKDRGLSDRDIFRAVMRGSAHIGDIPLFESYEALLKEKYKTIPLTYVYQDVFHNAVRGRNLPMVKYLIETKGIPYSVIRGLLREVVSSAHTDNDDEIIKYLSDRV